MDLKNDILIPNGFIEVPTVEMDLADLNEMDAKHPGWDAISPKDVASVATVLQNLAYYGFTVDANGLRALSDLDKADLAAWFKKVKPVLAELTKDNRQMDKHVVYKNFPREVLQMQEGEYVLRQLAIYAGAPYALVAEEAEPRAPLGDMKKLKVLALANENTPARIFQNLVSLNNRWNENQTVWATKLIGQKNVIDIDDFGFKENGIALMAAFFDSKEVHLDTGTDTLRLASALSGQDVSLREKVRFKKFSRPERKKLLALMNNGKNLGEDFATRPEQFKRLLERLRPGDYANEFPAVASAHDGLYNKTVKPFSALVDPQEIVPETLEIVATRPGVFLRNFHHFYDLFGDEAVAKMVGVMDKLNTRQLVNFRAYLGSINKRETMIYPPKANWARAKVAPKKKGFIAEWSLRKLDQKIGEVLSQRLTASFPEGVLLDPRTDQIKLQTNDQKLAEYGRGTTFDYGEEITFIRSASYWQIKGGWGWFDNGWNFFDDNWSPLGTLAWNQANFKRGAAIFSGDPYSGKTTDNRACQMIDLYPDKLLKAGVRFAVWNVLCYSRIKFSDTKEVLSALQLGEGSPEKGKLFEPARATMVFPLKSEHYSSYIVYVDLLERKIVYMDAPLKANVSSACNNEKTLSELMPAYVEYLNSLPSVHDLLRDAPKGQMPVMYSDAHLDLEQVEAKRAFVFRPENPQNTLDRVSVAELAAVGQES